VRFVVTSAANSGKRSRPSTISLVSHHVISAVEEERSRVRNHGFRERADFENFFPRWRSQQQRSPRMVRKT
jgi:hypothetical protein